MRKSQAKRRAKPGYVNPNKGRKDSKETREKKRKAHTGLKATDETKKKQRRSQLGHSVSKEARRKSSERNKGKDWHKNRDKVNQKARMVREQIKYEVFSEYSKRQEEISIDLEKQKILFGNNEISFDIDQFKKKCLLEGLDDIALSLEKSEKIKFFENNLKEKKPWIFNDKN